jgi:hypothetical protein
MGNRKTGERKLPEIDYEALMKPAKPGKWYLFKLRIKKFFGMNVILCNSCRWDWRSACHNRERPNATWCPDYQKKG